MDRRLLALLAFSVLRAHIKTLLARRSALCVLRLLILLYLEPRAARCAPPEHSVLPELPIKPLANHAVHRHIQTITV
jgi:hypothetical protein